MVDKVLMKKTTNLREIFRPFEEIAKKERLTGRMLAIEIRTEKQKTHELFKK